MILAQSNELNGGVDVLSLINLIVLTVTLIVLIWYAWETRKIQTATSRQVSLQIRPVVSLELQDKGTFKITNIGNGTAVNIKFERSILEPKSSESMEISFKVDPVVSLRVGESKEINVITLLNGKDMDVSFNAHIDQRYANRVVSFKVRYADIELNHFEQLFDFGLGNGEITFIK